MNGPEELNKTFIKRQNDETRRAFTAQMSSTYINMTLVSNILGDMIFLHWIL